MTTGAKIEDRWPAAGSDSNKMGRPGETIYRNAGILLDDQEAIAVGRGILSGWRILQNPYWIL
jgi:hypothetical protein